MTFETYVHNIVIDHQHPCKDARARGVSARTHISFQDHGLTNCWVHFSKIPPQCKEGESPRNLIPFHSIPKKGGGAVEVEPKAKNFRVFPASTKIELKLIL